VHDGVSHAASLVLTSSRLTDSRTHRVAALCGGADLGALRFSQHSRYLDVQVDAADQRHGNAHAMTALVL
jgi:hypothetical protein